MAHLNLTPALCRLPSNTGTHQHGLEQKAGRRSEPAFYLRTEPIWRNFPAPNMRIHSQQISTMVMKIARLRRVVLLLMALTGMTAQAEVQSLFVQSRLDYNAILITEVDVVFVYNDSVLENFPTTKTEWYANKRGFLESAGDNIDLVSIFVPQGFDSEMASLPQRRSQAIKVFVFGQHDSSTRPPIEITDFGNVLVEIDQFGILVSQRS